MAICVPYKAGSETWRYLMKNLDNHNVNDYEDEDEDVVSWEVIKDFKHVIQVRDPYERLLSAYRFTFQNKNRNSHSLKLNSVLLETYSHLPHETVKSRINNVSLLYQPHYYRMSLVRNIFPSLNFSSQL